MHLIRAQKLSPVDDFQSTFLTVSETGAIDVGLAQRIAPSVGLRNLIVHKYGQVDMKQAIEHIKKNLGQYEEYMHALTRWVDTVK